jgi:Xaa-Pro dipeptidase
MRLYLLWATQIFITIFFKESYFHWCFGVTEPDFYGAIDVNSGKSILFAPLLPEEYAVWMGKCVAAEYIFYVS